MGKLKKELTFGLSNYFKPTPKRIRIIGDGLLTISTTLSAYSTLMENKYISISVIIMGLLGKFITNLFAEK